MARIALSDFISGITGSVGGTTYAKNRYGWYRKNKPIPTNPNSPLQQAIRNYMTEAVANWKDALVVTDSAAWDHAASLHERTKMGQKFNLSGFNLYVGHYILCQKCGETPITIPTVFNGASEIPAPVIEEAVSGEAQITTWGEVDANLILVFKCTDSVPQTTSYRNSPFVFFWAGASGSAAAEAIEVAYPGAEEKYRIFYELSSFDLRGALSGKIAGYFDGTIAAV